jgi:nucleotide-binding universal stress UspA family protein
MSQSEPSFPPIVRSVFHPSDFGTASELAFAHALAIAVLRKAPLAILHSGQEHIGEDEWTRFPAVRATLERWGLLAEGSERMDVEARLGVRVQKIDSPRRNPLAAILDYLAKRPTDLMVLATGRRGGLPAWLRRSVAERAARRSQTITLFVPEGVRGFVSPTDGGLHLRRILLPIDGESSPELALRAAVNAARTMSDEAGCFEILQVGDVTGPELTLPSDLPWRLEHTRRSGEVVDEILAAAESGPADLVVMTTRGHDELLDLLEGSTTEQVLRRAPCPVLAIPATEPL